MRPSVVLAAGLLLGAACPAAGDGFRDRGPVQRVPPGLWGEGDPTPLPSPRGAGDAETLSPGSWQFWWAWNGDAVLASRLPWRSFAFTCGSCRSLAPAARRRMEAATEDWDRLIRPALSQIAVTSAEPAEARAAAVLALGRAKEELPLLRVIARDPLAPTRLRRAALLALGLSRADADCRPLLSAVARDGRVPDAERVHAMVALALLPRVAPLSPDLREIFERAVSRGNEEVAAGALFAAGVAAEEDSLAWLLDCGESGTAAGRALGDVLRAQAVAAAGRVLLPRRAESEGAGEAGARRSRILHAILRGAGPRTVLAAVAALGETLPRYGGPRGAEEEAAAATLVPLASGRLHGLEDPHLRGMALVAVARLAGGDDAMGARVQEVLEGAFRDPGGVAGWAAIAMGLAASRRGLPDRTRVDWGRAAAARLAARDAPDGERSASALALGLLDLDEHLGLLRRTVVDRREPAEVRRFGSLAVGLIRGAPARDVIRAALSDPGCSSLRRELCRAAEVQDDEECAGSIARFLEDPEAAAPDRGAAALALAAFGVRGVRDRLLTIARDPLRSRGALLRAAAIAALGGYARQGGIAPPGEERSAGELPRDDAIGDLAAGFHYRAWTPAVGEVLDNL